MSALSSQKCEECTKQTYKLTYEEAVELTKQVPMWKQVVGNFIAREYKFKNFVDAQIFVNIVGLIAERENHHPGIKYGWGYAEIMFTTHAIRGLSLNDFRMAAKLDEIYP